LIPFDPFMARKERIVLEQTSNKIIVTALLLLFLPNY